MDLWLVLALLVGGFLLRHFLAPYLSRRGENVATKADIADIARREEEGRADVTARLERLRGDIAKVTHVHRVQVELEVKTYEDLWKRLVELQRATLGLRPALDTMDSRDDGVIRERLKRFGAAYDGFRNMADARRPFYPADIFEEINALIRLVHDEAVEYQGDPAVNTDYWSKAVENQRRITAKVSELADLIRERLSRLAVVE